MVNPVMVTSGTSIAITFPPGEPLVNTGLSMPLMVTGDMLTNMSWAYVPDFTRIVSSAANKGLSRISWIVGPSSGTVQTVALDPEANRNKTASMRDVIVLPTANPPFILSFKAIHPVKI
jgi:hypothetical protein